MNDDRDFADPALDALLAEHSTERPSALVDAAILAAAHRAVDGAPQPAPATHAWRWWMPLAAAAVVGVIVVGVVPLAPTNVDEPAPVVSDLPAGARSGQGAIPYSVRIPDPRETALAETQSPAVPPPGARTESRTVAGIPPKVATPGTKLEPPPAAPAGIRQDRGAASTEARKGDAAAAGARGDALRADASGGITARSELARSPQKSAPPAATSADSRDDLAAQPRTPDEWIARIRLLRSEGNPHDALRALAAFRAAFPDADARLSPDLREWANASPRGR